MKILKVLVETSSESALKLFKERYKGKEANWFEQYQTAKLFTPPSPYVAPMDQLYCDQTKNKDKLKSVRVSKILSESNKAKASLELHFNYASGNCFQTISPDGSIKFRDVTYFDADRLQVSAESEKISYKTQTLKIWKDAYQKESNSESKKAYKEAFDFLVDTLKSSHRRVNKDLVSID